MAVEAVGRHFGLKPGPLGAEVPPAAPETVDAQSILSTYDPLADTAALRANPELFEDLRNHYALREEPTL